jgi:DNA-binding transcriptional ArsR family regulator
MPAAIDVAPMSPADVETVLGALADPTRRHVLEVLAAYPAASASALSRDLPISRQMVIKHLGVLQQSGLVRSVKAGREVLFEVQSAPLAQTADWLSSLAAQWDARLADLKFRAENP